MNLPEYVLYLTLLYIIICEELCSDNPPYKIEVEPPVSKGIMKRVRNPSSDLAIITVKNRRTLVVMEVKSSILEGPDRTVDDDLQGYAQLFYETFLLHNYESKDVVGVRYVSVYTDTRYYHCFVVRFTTNLSFHIEYYNHETEPQKFCSYIKSALAFCH